MKKGIIGGLVQAFYGWRVKVITGSWLLFGVIFLGALTNMLMGIGTAVAAQIVKSFTDFQKFQVLVIICGFSISQLKMNA
ncbi:hypothetical protein GYMLUDRAFT_248215 [Collybiopsis luxurians FD-317 M1]|uniref:Uncharacterized protein n=1 Tax=Collybiopsis luxurians FD-317 M1 TaxID=944289 RepID=A0A0D0AZ56_9AGAR|nr:hypothetical protein GYMLUDRAFT_248215 [Collybiopsis luxurians FD-317 M1]